MSGQTSYHAGYAAEAAVANRYSQLGLTVAQRRWRHAEGEVDLILRDGATVVFVEVKKSRTFAKAAARLSRHQMNRLCAAATAFVADEPAGQLTEMRFDLALVDAKGAVEIIENAFGEA